MEMATSQNPFPDKSAQKLKSKNAYYTGIVGAVKYNAPPLYYDETINASMSRNEEMSFDSQD